MIAQNRKRSRRMQCGPLTALSLALAVTACGDDEAAVVPAAPGGEAAQPGEQTELAAAPLFWRDVAPILQARCVTCHQGGGVAPFVLDEYESAKTWARPAAAAVAARVMPPWLMNEDGSCQHFESSRYLSESEIRTIVEWADTGAAEGTPGAAIIAPSTGHLDAAMAFLTPDFIPVAVGGELAEFDEYRCFRLDRPVDSPGFLTGYEVLPGNPALVHHVLVMPVDPAFVAPDGRSNEQVMLALDEESPERAGWPCFSAAGEGVEVQSVPVTWAPGMGPVRYPDNTGVGIEEGTVWVAQIHYNLAEASVRGQSDSTEIHLRLEPSVEKPGFFDLPDHFLGTLFEGEPATLAPGQAEVPYSWQLEVDDYLELTGGSELNLYGVFPHMHELGRSMRIERVSGAQSELECVGHVPRWDFNWQLFYFYDQPLTLRAGDQLRVTCNFDTSSRTEAVLPGWGTQNEMCLAGLFLVP